MNTILITHLPHTLTFRPLVVPDGLIVCAELCSKETDVFLTIDGQVDSGCARGRDRGEEGRGAVAFFARPSGITSPSCAPS